MRFLRQLVQYLLSLLKKRVGSRLLKKIDRFIEIFTCKIVFLAERGLNCLYFKLVRVIMP